MINNSANTDVAMSNAAAGRLLIVDDDRDAADALDELLRGRGYTVHSAYDSNEACGALKSFDPDVALIDIRLGQESGIDLIAKFKAHCPSMPCIMITAYADLEITTNALREGAFDFLSKPISIDMLDAALRRCNELTRIQRDKEQVKLALKQTEVRLHNAINSISEGFVLYDPEDKLVMCNDKYKEFYPQIREELVPGALCDDIAKMIVDRGAIRDFLENTDYGPNSPLTNQDNSDGRYEQELSDDRWLLCSDRKTADGHTVGIRADITEVKKAAAQLRQAQKMEAVGQLTGGIAHDFNNLLAVISGNTELLAEEFHDKNFDVLAESIMKATKRGAELTQRLLALSGQHPLRPRAIDLAQVTNSMSTLLKWTLREAIEVVTSSDDDLWLAIADVGQVENAILNLALNARDAMPQGGLLKIHCGNVSFEDASVAAQMELKPGDYVEISVIDSGIGMSSKIREQAFEPFFTTKEVGTGSGLGLAMIFSFAKQSGGSVSIRSEEGRGTTIFLYLPRSRAAAEEKRSRDTDEIPSGHGESLLVIEDDESVARLVVRMLQGLNYKVRWVPNSTRARNLLVSGTPFDGILSDVSLPGGMSGLEFAREVRAQESNMKFTFMSGYAGDAIAADFDDLGSILISKPFKRAALAKAMRDMLNART